MKKITKDNDLIFNVILRDNECNIIPVEGLSSIKYTFYTDSTYHIDITEINEGKIYLPSSVMANFNKGILKYDVHIALDNEHFPDGTQDIYYHNRNTNIYIK